MASQFLILSLAVAAAFVFSPASGQITTPCTPSMISTFTPCITFVSGSSSLNGSSPPSQCCDSLKSLMSSGKDCLCLIATGSVPFNIPINRTLALSLPRACNMPGVPLQCKAAGAPASAPEPAVNGPSLTPTTAPTSSAAGQAPPESLSPRSAPAGDETPTPPAPATSSGTPTSNTGSRAGVTPSAAQPSHSVSPLYLVAVLGAIALKYY